MLAVTNQSLTNQQRSQPKVIIEVNGAGVCASVDTKVGDNEDLKGWW